MIICIEKIIFFCSYDFYLINIEDLVFDFIWYDVLLYKLLYKSIGG